MWRCPLPSVANPARPLRAVRRERARRPDEQAAVASESKLDRRAAVLRRLAASYRAKARHPASSSVQAALLATARDLEAEAIRIDLARAAS
jgi:hypothetical protein